MKILVLHNNNLPFFLRTGERFNLKEDIAIYSKILKYDSSISHLSFDSFICTELSFLKDEWFDIIVLPYTFNENNYMEYSGLRVTTHIRLTKEWHHVSAPILFLGPDKIDDIIRLSELGSIISSYRVFMTDVHDEDEIEMKIREIVSNYPHDNETEQQHPLTHNYTDMIAQLTIKAPANYATHHSIANEWAVIRWIQMFSWKENEPKIEDKEIINMLYFKHLMAKTGIRDSFTKKKKQKDPIYPIIRGIEGKRVLFIDDEGGKGWYDLLQTIFKNSKAELITYHYNDKLSKAELFQSLKDFVDDEMNNIDCYLIDLRLHEDDFKKGIEPKDYTGILIAEHIKQNNIGNQVVMFTASNKTWNYEAAIKNVGVNDYVIKESPEYNYSRHDTYMNYCKLSGAIQNAIKKSYIAKYSDLIDSFSFLKDEHRSPLINFVEMLALDEEKTIKTNIINLSVFVESYIIDNFAVPSPGANLTDINDQTKKFCQVSPKNFMLNNDCTKVKIHDKPQPKPPMGSKSFLLNYNNPFGLILLALHYYFGFTEDECNMYLKLRKERNNGAHRGEVTSFKINDLKEAFEKIVLKILKKGSITWS